MDETPGSATPHGEEPHEAPSHAPGRTRCEVYSRVVGYLRPVHHWNNGKRQEFADRRPFKIPA